MEVLTLSRIFVDGICIGGSMVGRPEPDALV